MRYEALVKALSMKSDAKASLPAALSWQTRKICQQKRERTGSQRDAEELKQGFHES